MTGDVINRALVIRKTELPEKECPDISVTVDSSAHARATAVSRLVFSAQENWVV